MILDPTDEIRTIRNRLAAKFNYDVDLIVEEARRHQAESRRTYISLPARPVEPPFPLNQPLYPGSVGIVSELTSQTSPPR